VTQQCTV